MKRVILTMMLVGALSNLSGCIVWEIRDEMRKTNANLVDVQERLTKLDTTNNSLDRTNEAIARTNALIDSVEHGLGRIDATNMSLGDVQKRLALLQSIDTSLTHLDAHLASLRKTINKLDGVIPFLDLGGDVPVEPTPPAGEPAVAAADGGAAAAEGVAPAAADTQTAASAPAAKREAMGGTWLTQYPSRDNALVVMHDGRYVWATRSGAGSGPGSASGGTVVIEKGTWKRTASTLAFQADPVEVPADPKKPDSKPTTRPGRSWSMNVVAQTPKSATVEIDGSLTVMARP